MSGLHRFRRRETCFPQHGARGTERTRQVSGQNEMGRKEEKPALWFVKPLSVQKVGHLAARDFESAVSSSLVNNLHLNVAVTVAKRELFACFSTIPRLRSPSKFLP